MARPKAKELTPRELEIMHYFWSHGPATAVEVRDGLASAGLDRAYTTIATLIRILTEKGALEQSGEQRPFTYRPVRPYHEVASSLLADLTQRVFHGSREQLLVHLFGKQKLTAQERAALEALLKESRS